MNQAPDDQDPMTTWLSGPVSYLEAHGIKNAIFILPFEADQEDVRMLLSHPRCAGVVVRTPSLLSIPIGENARVGRYTSDGLAWILPSSRGRLIFLGSHLLLSRRMLRQILSAGQLSIVCKSQGGMGNVPLYRFLLWRLGDRTVRRVVALSQNSILRSIIYSVRSLPLAKWLWHRFFKRPSPIIARTWNGDPPIRSNSESSESHSNPRSGDIPGIADDEGQLDVSFFRELLRRARATATRADMTIPKRVILINAGLAAGGAERQIVNTLIGLRTKDLESVTFLGEYLHRAPGLDFYLPKLRSHDLEITGVKRRITLEEHGLASLPPDVAEMLAMLPARMVEEIMNLVEEFRVRRPEVVHAWQDSTSINSGIAAAISGVPRVVLFSRNVNPTHFEYFQNYMKSAYLALAELGNVKLANNSEAGAADYCLWLGLDRHRFQVIRNGVDLSTLMRLGPTRALAYRTDFDVPADATVIGSVFRFWPEKRPMLWLEVMARIHAVLPDVHFFLAGDGPLRPLMEKFVSQSGITHRVHMTGTASDVAMPLSIMDLFVLTSEFEGTPNVVLEAQWLGVPVVATDSGGTREAICEGVSGWIARSHSAEDIAQLVIEKLKDRPALELATVRAPQFVEERYGLPRMLDETLHLYGYV